MHGGPGGDIPNLVEELRTIRRPASRRLSHRGSSVTRDISASWAASAGTAGTHTSEQPSDEHEQTDDPDHQAYR